MPVDLKCNRCNGIMGTFDYNKVRDYVQANGETCKHCLKREETLMKFFEHAKTGYVKQLDKIAEQAKLELAEKIRELADEPD